MYTKIKLKFKIILFCHFSKRKTNMLAIYSYVIDDIILNTIKLKSGYRTKKSQNCYFFGKQFILILSDNRFN